MKKALNFKVIIFLIFSFVFLGCGKNIFNEIASGRGDDSLFFSAKQLLNDQQYTKALEKINKMSVDYKAKISVQRILASAYAGQCGMEFIEFFSSLKDFSDATLFKFLMKTFTGKESLSSACTQAEAAVLGFSPDFISRSDDDGIFLTILSMIKIGTYLRENADKDGTNDLGDGDVDVGFDVCQSSSLSDDNLDQVITGFGLLLENFPVVGGVLSDGSEVTATVDTLASACQLPGAPANDNPCLLTSTESITATHRTVFRLLLNEKDFGVGNCDQTTAPGGILGCC